MDIAYLGRNDAPISAGTWKTIDFTMTESAKTILSGRRLLSIEGPYGFGLKAVPQNDTQSKSGVATASFLPLSTVNASFTLGKRDLAAFERETLPPDLGKVAAAALDAARQEENIVYQGNGGVPGLMAAKGSGSLKMARWDTVGKAADDIISAINILDDAGFHGPYCMALAPKRYNLLMRRYPQGEGTELAHIGEMVMAGIYKAPALGSGGVILASGRQYASIVIGQDMSVGYTGPSGENLEFFISETLVPFIRSPGAICVLKEQ